MEGATFVWLSVAVLAVVLGPFAWIIWPSIVIYPIALFIIMVVLGGAWMLRRHMAKVGKIIAIDADRRTENSINWNPEEHHE